MSPHDDRHIPFAREPIEGAGLIKTVMWVAAIAALTGMLFLSYNLTTHYHNHLHDQRDAAQEVDK